MRCQGYFLKIALRTRLALNHYEWSQIKGTQQLKEVNDAIKFINEKFEEFEADRREKEREIAELKSTRKSLNVCLDKADRTLDRQEQYSRRNCLLIHGIVEENQENTDEVLINALKKEMDTSRYR